jgi:ring-1,2-phenylacetyl-CoA epoxidase subunit PaaD
VVAAAVSREEILGWLGEVADPEIPVLSITDLGIVRDVSVGDTVTVALTPT